MTNTDKEAFVGIMIAIAAADDNFDAVESKQIVLNSMQGQMGISEERFREIVNTFLGMVVSTGKESVSTWCKNNLAADYRVRAFHYAVDIAVCNGGELGTRESEALDIFAEEWGISDADKLEVINVSKKKYL